MPTLKLHTLIPAEAFKNSQTFKDFAQKIPFAKVSGPEAGQVHTLALEVADENLAVVADEFKSTNYQNGWRIDPDGVDGNGDEVVMSTNFLALLSDPKFGGLAVMARHTKPSYRRAFETLTKRFSTDPKGFTAALLERPVVFRDVDGDHDTRPDIFYFDLKEVALLKKSAEEKALQKLEGLVAKLQAAQVTPECFDRYEVQKDPVKCGAAYARAIEAIGDPAQHVSWLKALNANQLAFKLFKMVSEGFIVDDKAQTIAFKDEAKIREIALSLKVLEFFALQPVGKESAIVLNRPLQLVAAYIDPNLDPKSRFDLVLLSQSAQALQKKRAGELPDYFSKLKDFDGKTRWMDRPEQKDANLFFDGLINRYSFSEMATIERVVLPLAETEAEIAKAGWTARYQALQKLDNDSLLSRWTVMGGLDVFYELPPILRREAVIEGMLITTLMSVRGLDSMTLSLEQNKSFWKIFLGLGDNDSEQMNTLALAALTVSKLDNAKARQAFIKILSEKLTAFFKLSPEQKAKSTTADTLGALGMSLFNPAFGRVFTFEDLVAVRRLVMEKVPQKLTSFKTWEDFAKADPKKPVQVSTADIAGWSPAIEIEFPETLPGGKKKMTFAELVTSDMDQALVLPQKLYPNSESIAQAPRLMGLLMINKESPDAKHKGTVLSVMAHECAHNLWYQINYNTHPERLAYNGLEHRFVYAVQRAYLKAYLAGGHVKNPEETQEVQKMLEYVERVIRRANWQLGLPCDDMSPKTWDASFENKDEPFFKNDFADGTLEAIDNPADVDHWTKGMSDDEMLKKYFALLEPEFNRLKVHSRNRKIICDEMTKLYKMAPEEISETYGPGHPLTEMSKALEWTQDTSITFTGYYVRQMIRAGVADSEFSSTQRLMKEEAAWLTNEIKGLSQGDQKLILEFVDRSASRKFLKGRVKKDHPLVQLYDRLKDKVDPSEPKLSDKKFPMKTDDTVWWLYRLARVAIDKAHSQQCRPY